MRARTLIGIVTATLIVSLAVAGGLWWADRSPPSSVLGPEGAMPRSADADPVKSLPGRPVVPRPDDPVGTDAAAPAEPLTAPVLEPRRPPALAPVPRPAAGGVTVAVVVLPALSRVAEPADPVLAADADLAERIVVPALSRFELLPPSHIMASGDCRGAARGGAL